VRKFHFLIVLFFLLHRCAAQADSTSLQPKRLLLVSGSELVLGSGSLIGLNELWYKDYPRSDFHFFNDNEEWLQMDKMGHLTTSYHVGRVGVGLLKWSGVKRRKAIWYGGLLGTAYLSAVEVMDGYSEQWGFSWGDFGSNAAGSMLCIGQELLWDEQRITLKFSFRQSPYAAYRPNLLGDTYVSNLLKDYNGQTYWLSVNPSMFMSSDSRFPRWLNIAVGYGAEGMTGGSFNPPFIDGHGNQVYFERYRQIYLSLDVDLSRLPIKGKAWKVFSSAIGFVKVPAPAVEFSRNGVKGSLIGF
jgi:hypothetical protein